MIAAMRAVFLECGYTTYLFSESSIGAFVPLAPSPNPLPRGGEESLEGRDPSPPLGERVEGEGVHVNRNRAPISLHTTLTGPEPSRSAKRARLRARGRGAGGFGDVQSGDHHVALFETIEDL